jgi:hypothetical protein
LVKALNRVDLPPFGKPTMPIDSATWGESTDA